MIAISLLAACVAHHPAGSSGVPRSDARETREVLVDPETGEQWWPPATVAGSEFRECCAAMARAVGVEALPECVESARRVHTQHHSWEFELEQVCLQVAQAYDLDRLVECPAQPDDY